MYFKLRHAVSGSNYERIIGMVAQKNDSTILAAGLEFGAKDGYFVGLGKGQVVGQVGRLTHYQFSSDDGGTERNFVGLDRPMRLSPLSDKLNPDSPWVVVSLIPKEDYDKMIRLAYIKLGIFCLAFLIVTIFMIHYVSKRYLLPISQGIDAVKSGSAQQTNIREIDDLVEFMMITHTQTTGDTNSATKVSEADMSAFHQFMEDIKKLSTAETEIFKMYIQGASANEIADKLCIAMNTLKYHNRNIYQKLNVSSRKELLVYAKFAVDIAATIAITPPPSTKC
jgi:DNA-binding CsgD family transcriptional regulator